MKSDDIARGGSNRGRRVCVVGAGIGGLTAALAFARTGAVVEVHEQAAQISEVGAGLQITPNGARVLEVLGLRDALDRTCVVARAVEPMDALRGRAVTRFDLSHLDGPPYRFFHRADLIGILEAACRDAGVVLHLNSRMIAADMDADIVVGAEGLHSPTRAALNGPPKPFFTGQVAWRAMVDAPSADPVARIWMAPHRHIVTYPVSGGRLNIVAVQERGGWADEGWTHADDPANLRAAFVDVAQPLREILDQVDQVRLWGLFRHAVADIWARDNLFLLGDAAHPTLPFLAQGANLAIEDAFVLAQCCDRDDGAAYTGLRKPRVTRAITAANANAKRYHLGGAARCVAFTGLRTLGLVAPKAFLGRMDWLYGFDATQSR